MAEQKTFPVLATVTLGRLKRGHLYLEALRHVNVLFANSAESLLPRVPCAETNREVDVVAVSPADLGINAYDRCERFLQAANDYGLELCPAEVAPALLIVWKPDKSLRFAMEQIVDKSPSDLLKGLGHRFDIMTMWGRKVISSNCADFVEPDELWAFVQPRR